MLTKNLTRGRYNSNIAAQHNSRAINRSDFIRKMLLLTGAIATGCSPVKILLNSYSDKYDKEQLRSKVLNSFVSTVIPGAEKSETKLCKIFSDTYYPFAKRCGYFASDLCNRSKELFGTETFYDLSFGERTRVIQSGLDADALTKKLYTAAIYMAQVSFYAGIYDDDKGCELIDFQGGYGFVDVDITYPGCSSFLAIESTLSGNYS